MGKVRNKKWSSYKKALIIFTLILLVVAVYTLIYVSSVLKNYEKGDLSSFMSSLVDEITEDAKDGDISKHISLKKVSSEYEKKSNLKEGYKNLFTEHKHGVIILVIMA